MLLHYVFVFLNTVISARATRTGLDKKLNAEEFLSLSNGEAISPLDRERFL